MNENNECKGKQKLPHSYCSVTGQQGKECGWGLPPRGKKEQRKEMLGVHTENFSDSTSFQSSLCLQI